MKQQKVIFSDHEIVDFCSATKDTNEIHNPEFMEKLGKRVIVPGMLALSRTLNLEVDHLKSKVNCIHVFFNSLLSSGDFATLCTAPVPDRTSGIKLSAINHVDTLTTKSDYTKMYWNSDGVGNEVFPGILRSLPVESWQLRHFSNLVGCNDHDINNFLFSIAYASQALLKSIDEPESEVEQEIGRVINSPGSRISPFYQSLEILFPHPFPVFTPGSYLDYYTHFVQEKPNKLYTAHLRCESWKQPVFHARYKMMGIPDIIILRMAKELHLVKSSFSQQVD
ncbi:MAG: MaoC family dehydratase [Bacteroidota bacterium]